MKRFSLIAVVILGGLLALALCAAVPNEDGGSVVDNGYPVTVQRSHPGAGYPAPVIEEQPESEPVPVMEPTKPAPETERAHSLSCRPDDTGLIVCK